MGGELSSCDQTPLSGNRAGREGCGGPQRGRLAPARRRPEERFLARLEDPILRWLALDGYGFHEGIFRRGRYIEGRAELIKDKAPAKAEAPKADKKAAAPKADSKPASTKNAAPAKAAAKKPSKK